MIKFLFLTKNNKASILPVTVIAMFIMMIIAYACIKMFLVQNIIITQDQIKARVTYAAAGIAQKQIMRLQAAINAKINQDPNVKITADTVFDATGIKNLKKNGTNYNFLFADILNQTATQDPDVVSGQDFFTAKGMNAPGYTDSILEGVIMFPRIKSLGATIGIPSTALPTAVRKDGGVAFYKSKGVTVTESQLKYNDYMNINNTIYPISNSNDPRWQNSPNPMKNNPSAYDSSFGNTFAEFYVCTASTYMNSPGTTSAQKLFYRIKIPSNSTAATVIGNNISTVKSKLTTLYPLNGGNGAANWTNLLNDIGAPDAYNNVRITAWHTSYLIKNFRQGYVIIGKAKSPAISNKIPEITSEVRIYFDLFMAKLYKKYQGIKAGENVVWWLNRKNWDSSYNGGTMGWSTGWQQSGDPISYPLESSEHFISDNTNKLFTKIEFHIQKWEVVS